MENISGTRRFIDEWLKGRERRFGCVVDVAQQANSELVARLALESLAGGATPEDGVLTVNCKKQDCNGCVRLIMENAGVEAVDCAIRGTTEQ